MIKFEEIRNRLINEWHNGNTQAELAKKYGINQQNIGKIIAGQTEGKRINIDMLNRLFPNCSTGGEITIGNNSTTQINSPLASISNGESRIQRIIERIITSDLPSDSKDKALNLIIETK